MAEKSFPLPDLGEGLIDATILEWLVKPGDRIERNDPLVEVETTKSALELPSPMSGVVKTLHGESGDCGQGRRAAGDVRDPGCRGRHRGHGARRGGADATACA